MSEIERAIETLEAYKRVIEDAKQDARQAVAFGLGIYTTRLPDMDIAIDALKEKLEREKNEPLTIEEILDMNGKPVWCQTGDGYEGWALVIVDKYQDGGHYLYLFSDNLTRDGINECFEPDEDFINLKFSDDPDGHFGLHVLGWRAYRYEPKGEKE